MFSLCFPIIGHAQTARWLLQPKYQSILPYGESHYKANTFSSMSIYDTNGKKIIEADSITFITNGYALALAKVNGKYKLQAIIDKSVNVRTISEEYYVSDHHFFSEDMLGVSNKKGKFGYINPDGKVVIQCQYAAVHPFCEGLASVSKAPKGIKGLIGATKKGSAPLGPATYVDHKGTELDIRDGKNFPILATSFRNGQGLIQMEDGNSFYVNSMGKRISNGPNETDLELDDYYALKSGNAKKSEVNIPFVPTYNSVYSIYSDGALKGYLAHGLMMVPSQFQEAYGFSSGYAIVKKDDKYGILQQINGSIDIKVSEKGGKISAKGLIPAEWDDHQAKFVRIVNGTERLSFAMSGMRSMRTVEGDVLSSNGMKTYEVDIDGLIIWRQSGTDISDNGKTSDKGGIAVSAPAKVKANAKGECVINIRVTNRDDTAQTISVSLSTGGSKSIKLGAGKSGSVSITTKISKETKCSITAKSSRSNASCTTNLLPSFVL